MKYIIQYICILFLTTTANIYSADNSSVTKAGLTPLNFPRHINDGDLKNISITNFSHICFFKLNDKNTICYAVAHVEGKNKIIKISTKPPLDSQWSWVSQKIIKKIDNDVEFFGPLGSQRICALKNSDQSDIYIKIPDPKNKRSYIWNPVFKYKKYKGEIITSCVGLSNESFWVTTYNNQTKKTFTVNLVLDEETQKYTTKEPTDISTVHVAITQNNDYGWFIKKHKSIENYRLYILDFNDPDFTAESTLSLGTTNIDSIHHLTARNDEEAFFLNQNNKYNLYKLTNKGNISLLLQNNEPIDAIGIWDNRLILTIGNQLYRYIPINQEELIFSEKKVEDKNLDDQKEELIKTSETASPAIASSQSLSTPENTQKKPIKINTTEPITETVLTTIPSSQPPSTSTSNQEPLEEIKKSEPLIINQSVGIKKSQPRPLVFEEETNLRKTLSKKRKNPKKPETKIVPPTTTSNQPAPTDINNQKPTLSNLERFKHSLAAILYRMSPQIKQPTQNPIQTAAPQKEEETIKQPGTYYQTLKNWFNNIRNWWLPF